MKRALILLTLGLTACEPAFAQDTAEARIKAGLERAQEANRAKLQAWGAQAVPGSVLNLGEVIRLRPDPRCPPQLKGGRAP